MTGFSAEGGTLVAFYEGDALRKLVATYLGESGKASEEYYFWDGQLFFVFRTDSTYDKPFGTVVRTDENRYYFANARMIRWIDESNDQGRQLEPLDVGHTHRHATRYQRAALAERDHGCAHPGCTTPAKRRKPHPIQHQHELTLMG